MIRRKGGSSLREHVLWLIRAFQVRYVAPVEHTIRFILTIGRTPCTNSINFKSKNHKFKIKMKNPISEYIKSLRFEEFNSNDSTRYLSSLRKSNMAADKYPHRLQDVVPLNAMCILLRFSRTLRGANIRPPYTPLFLSNIFFRKEKADPFEKSLPRVTLYLSRLPDPRIRKTISVQKLRQRR